MLFKTLIVGQLLKKVTVFHSDQMFITVLTHRRNEKCIENSCDIVEECCTVVRSLVQLQTLNCAFPIIAAIRE
jgi:hypothetical protein